MLRRAKQTVDPLSAQSRTLAVTSAGDLITLRNEFETDKASKDTRMNTAETDITTLQNSATGIVDGGRADVQHLEATQAAQVLTDSITSDPDIIGVSGGNAALTDPQIDGLGANASDNLDVYNGGGA